LKDEDRIGFDESQVEFWTPPSDGGIYVVPERYVTDDSFTFIVRAATIPEPASLTIAAVVVAMLLISRAKRR